MSLPLQRRTFFFERARGMTKCLKRGTEQERNDMFYNCPIILAATTDEQ